MSHTTIFIIKVRFIKNSFGFLDMLNKDKSGKTFLCDPSQMYTILNYRKITYVL